MSTPQALRRSILICSRLRTQLVHFLIVVTAASTGVGAAADDGLPPVSLWQGDVAVFFDSDEPDRSLVDCPDFAPPGPDGALIRAVFARLNGVCDDQTDRPCDGRLTYLYKRCFTDDVRYRVPEDDSVSIEYAKAKIRICYDETAKGHCGEVDEVARARVVAHVQGSPLGAFIDNPTAGDVTGLFTTAQRITRSSPFRLDGHRVRVRRGSQTGQAVFRCVGPAACATAGSFIDVR